jgi:hypothetical protein
MGGQDFATCQPTPPLPPNTGHTQAPGHFTRWLSVPGRATGVGSSGDSDIESLP